MAEAYADHFLNMYPKLVESVCVRLEQHGWNRMNAKPLEPPRSVDELHNHPFSFTREEPLRSVRLTKARGEKPKVVASLPTLWC